MKGIGILAAEWLMTGLIVYAGLSGRQILFINGPRTAVITLGTIGFAMCMIMPTIGKFISNAPAHPLTIMGTSSGRLRCLQQQHKYSDGKSPSFMTLKLRFL